MWWRLEASARNNRKVRSVSDSARWLWACCGMYAAEQLTDGFVPDAELDRLTAERDAPGALKECIGAGLLVRAKGGISVHDYLEYNPSAAEVKRLTSSRSKAGRKGAAAKSATSGKCHKHVPQASDSSNGLMGGWVDGSIDPKGGERGGTQARILGLHCRLVSERIRAQATPDHRGAPKAAEWAQGRTWDEVERVVRGYVADDDPRLVKERWPLSWLPDRANRYTGTTVAPVAYHGIKPGEELIPPEIVFGD